MRQVGSVLWPKLRTLQIYGANTGVGKTVVSTLLLKRLKKHLPDYDVRYVKPVSTGPLTEADNSHITKYCRGVLSKTLYQFDEPVSPHIAARTAKEPIDDQSILVRLDEELSSYASGKDGFVVVETAGGVLSPAPSGNAQADFYRPLRLPVSLVGDHKLGGIATTISAWESLHVRGYDVGSVMLFEESRYDNHTYLKDYFADRGILTVSLPPPPAPATSLSDDEKQMSQYYADACTVPALERVITQALEAHTTRLTQLQSLPARAEKTIWHPFMQHTERTERNILAIDSAYGDYFQTYQSLPPSESQTRQRFERESHVLKPAFDGSASWWTQGLGHGNPKLALTAAHAAGRYGHVMFGGAAHEPAVGLAEMLLRNVGNPRLSRVFYTDNGSTGMEVAVKMALKAASKRYGWDAGMERGEGRGDQVRILGLKGSYHGDTMGTMDCSEPSVYNRKVEWYKGKGHWFDFPLVKMKEGKWLVEPPQGMEDVFGPPQEFENLDQVFELPDRGAVAEKYERYLKNELERLAAQGIKFGALIMEPVILGAGGMLFADPLFQHTLVKVVREHAPSLYQTQGLTTEQPDELSWRGIPVVFDEVFTGLYRLGRFSSSSFLQTQPDISVHAKLLTGGLLPLCTTLASESIFDAFLSNDKTDALLHGHSYTAHAVGCDIAKFSLQTMMEMDRGGKWNGFKKQWAIPTTGISGLRGKRATVATAPAENWSMWSKDFVTEISYEEKVESLFALGSVLAISMKDPAGSGYTSTAATGLRDQLLAGTDVADSVIHSRVLGNVLYLMASMTTTRETLESIEEVVKAAIK